MGRDTARRAFSEKNARRKQVADPWKRKVNREFGRMLTTGVCNTSKFWSVKEEERIRAEENAKKKAKQGEKGRGGPKRVP